MAPQTPLAMDKTLSINSDSGDDRSASYVTPDDKDVVGGSASNAAFESDWVKEPTENDVLCGRGGSINSHPGNERFRLLVEKRKRVYLTARFKREKRLIASSIVSEIRALKPSGRFLSRDPKTGKWKDIGDEKARDKTSQALRENAPSIRAEIETEIKEHRVDVRVDDDRITTVGSAAQAPAPPPPPPPYYSHWGYQGYYYGHPPPPHHSAYPPPPPPPPPSHYDGHPWPPPPPPHYHAYGARPGDPYSHHHHMPHHAQPPPPPQSTVPKSTLEQTAETVVSSVETLKNILSFGGPVASVASNDATDNNSRTSVNTKPIVYVHESGDKKRRMVKFREDSYNQRGRYRRSKIPATYQQSSNSSFLDMDQEDMEPENIELSGGEVDANASLMSQVANHILNSFGSWDASSIMCGHDSSDDRVPFPRSSGGNRHRDDATTEQLMQDDDMAGVEWEEGQEVLLVEDKPAEEYERHERMPPPVARRPMEREQSSLGGFSSLGSCHSWLPEQISGAASFFTGSRGGISPVGSYDMAMDYNSAIGTETCSNNSLTRVFEHEPLDEPLPTSPLMNHRVLNQVPSWERSVRSRSPLSLGSGGDDESLISKSSSKLSEGGNNGTPLNKDGSDGMVWESRE